MTVGELKAERSDIDSEIRETDAGFKALDEQIDTLLTSLTPKNTLFIDKNELDPDERVGKVYRKTFAMSVEDISKSLGLVAGARFEHHLRIGIP